MKVTVINIRKNGSDSAVVLNGKLICSADPSCGDCVGTILVVANNLAESFGVTVDYIDATPESDWNWDDVIADLLGEVETGVQADGTTVLLDTVIKDWRLKGSGNDESVPVADRCEYTLRVERGSVSGAVYLSVYNKELDKLSDSEIIKSGLHCSIEIRDGVPALSVGVRPDNNVLHIMSNTSNKLAVIPDEDSPVPIFQTVDFMKFNHFGYCYHVGDDSALMETRNALADARFENLDFGNRIVVDDSGWEVEDAVWRKSVFFEDENDGSTSNGVLELIFMDNGTHIISQKEF